MISIGFFICQTTVEGLKATFHLFPDVDPRESFVPWAVSHDEILQAAGTSLKITNEIPNDSRGLTD
jgi:hypothetical protein